MCVYVSLYLFIHLSQCLIYLSIYAKICVCVCVCLSLYLFIHLSQCLIYLSIYLSMQKSVCVCVCVYVSLYLFIHLSQCLIYLSIYLSISIFSYLSLLDSQTISSASDCFLFHLSLLLDAMLSSILPGWNNNSTFSFTCVHIVYYFRRLLFIDSYYSRELPWTINDDKVWSFDCSELTDLKLKSNF